MVYRCVDKEDISRIINHPKVFKWLSDDLSPSPFVPVVEDLYIMNEEKTGVIRIDPVNGITCEVHTATLPELWGRSDKFVKEVITWGFTNTLYQKAITYIPKYNRPAIQIAKRCGMVKEGRITRSFLKKWKLYDMEIYGLQKKEFLKEVSSCQ